MPRLLSSLSLVLVLVSPGFMTCQSLEHESKAAVSSLTFDVASIRPARDHSGRWMIAMPPSPGRFSATGITLMSLVEYAYHSHHLRSFQIVDAPNWAYSDRFDISAKTDDAGTEAGTGHGTSPTDEKDHIDEHNCIRLQALLADRFHLKVRFDSKMMPVLVMTSLKGSKLKASSATSGTITSGFGFLKATGVTPAAIAAALAGSLQEQVVDETGLGGSYDFDLKWKPDTDVSSDESGASIYTAVKEQLGLQLRPEKRIGPVLVVERAEKPTAN